MLKTCQSEQTDDIRQSKENLPVEEQKGQSLPDILSVTEIKIEEVSIDGICGVY
jgi:mycofactocin precursor